MVVGLLFIMTRSWTTSGLPSTLTLGPGSLIFWIVTCSATSLDGQGGLLAVLLSILLMQLLANRPKAWSETHNSHGAFGIGGNNSYLDWVHSICLPLDIHPRLVTLSSPIDPWWSGLDEGWILFGWIFSLNSQLVATLMCPIHNRLRWSLSLGTHRN